MTLLITSVSNYDNDSISVLLVISSIISISMDVQTYPKRFLPELNKTQ